MKKQEKQEQGQEKEKEKVENKPASSDDSEGCVGCLGCVVVLLIPVVIYAPNIFTLSLFILAFLALIALISNTRSDRDKHIATILKYAKDHGNEFSLSDMVVECKITVEEAEKIIDFMLDKGLIELDIDNLDIKTYKVIK